MSANYNTALFRQLQAPLMDALRQIEGNLEKLLSNQIKPSEVGLNDRAHEVTSSLKMVGRPVLAKLALTVEEGVSGLNTPERNGWDYIKTQAVARALNDLVKAFSLHVQDMMAGNDDLHVRLWPMWVKVIELMDQPVPSMDELFEIDPDFEGDKFSPRPAEYLKTVTDGAYERLTQAIGGVEVARTRADMEAALRKATEVFNQIYALRHRRAHQTYWLVVRARLAVGLMDPNGLLEAREEWLALLRNAGLQLRKFGADARRIELRHVQEVLQPLMKPWPKEWAMAHPTLAELDRRLGLSVFWQASREISASTVEGAASMFSSRQKELGEGIGQLKNHWNKVVAAPEKQRQVAVAGFLRALVTFGPKREWFPGTLVNPLFDGLQALGDSLALRLKTKEQPPFSSHLGYEVATTLLLLNEVVERRARWSQDLEVRCTQQARRLALAVAGRDDELKNIQPLLWDSKWRERQVEKANRQALEIVFHGLDEVERVLSGLAREDDEEDSRQRLDELKSRCRQMGLVFETLRLPIASKVVTGARDLISNLVVSPSIDEPLRQLAVTFTALKRFIVGRKNSDTDADALLAPALDLLFGEGTYRTQFAEESPQEEVLEGAVPEGFQASASHEAEQPAEFSQASVDASPVRDIRSDLLGDGVVDVPNSSDILEIFLEEAREAMVASHEFRQELLKSPHNEEAWLGLRRQFHTLKGSGRICGLEGLGEVAWWVEEKLNEAISIGESYSKDLDSALELSSERLNGWYEELRQGAPEVLVTGREVRDALARAVPFFGVTSDPDQEGDIGLGTVGLEDTDLSNIWPDSSNQEPEVESLALPVEPEPALNEVLEPEQADEESPLTFDVEGESPAAPEPEL